MNSFTAASANEALKAADVAPSQISRWLARGRGAAPGTRFRQFYLAATLARAEPTLQALPPDPDPAELKWAVAFLERSGQWEPPPPIIRLTFDDA
jgi:hypothetical protein